MISINLLPYHLRPVKRTPLPYILSLLVLVAAVAGIGYTFVLIQAKIMGVKAQVASVEEKFNQPLVTVTDAEGNERTYKAKEVVEEYNKLVADKNQFADILITIDEIVRDRMVWSRHLYNLSRLAPDNLWYKGIEVTEERVPVERWVVNPQTKKREKKVENVLTSILRVSGYVTEPREGGRPDINPFAIACERDPEFSRDFQLHETDMKDTDFEGFPVREFTLEFTITPGGHAQ